MSNASPSTYGTLVVLQPTSFCNIDCKYCYLPDRAKKNHMSLAVVERVAEEFFSTNEIDFPVLFLWHLGEPLAASPEFYKSAFSMLSQASRASGRGYTNSFQTNGTLLNDTWISLIKEHDVRIGISLDGPAFIHDRKRVTRKQGGTHLKVMQGISKLRQAGVPFGVITVLTDFALDFPREIFDFFVSNDIDDVAFNIDEIDGENTSSTFLKTNSQNRLRAFLLEILRMSTANPQAFKIREVWTTLRNISLGQNHLCNTTNTPLKIINIGSDGNFSTFCPELRAARSDVYNDFIMGNILTDSLSNIWSNPTFIKVNAEIQKGVSMCKQDCKYWSLCGGGSPSNKFFEHGRFDVTETLTCRMHKQTTIDAIFSHVEELLTAGHPT